MNHELSLRIRRDSQFRNFSLIVYLLFALHSRVLRMTNVEFLLHYSSLRDSMRNKQQLQTAAANVVVGRRTF